MNNGRFTCIVGNRSEINTDLMEQMYSERRRCLVDKLGWDLKTVNGLEFDQFDRAETEYVIVLENGAHSSSLRLNKNSISKSLINYMSDLDYNSCREIWEISRFISSNFSFSTSEYILFSAVQYLLRSKEVDFAYATLNKSIARIYRMIGMEIIIDRELNNGDGTYKNYRIDMSNAAFEKFIQRAPARDAAYLHLLERKWESAQIIRQGQSRYARIARPQFMESLRSEEARIGPFC